MGDRKPCSSAAAQMCGFSTEVVRDVQLALARRVCNKLSRQPDRIWSAIRHFIIVIFPDWRGGSRNPV